MLILCLFFTAQKSAAEDPVVKATVSVGLTPSFTTLGGIQFTLLNDPGAGHSQLSFRTINEALTSSFFAVGTATPNKSIAAWGNISGINSGVNPLFQFDFPIIDGGYPRFTIDTMGKTVLEDTSGKSFGASAANFVVSTAYLTRSGVTQYFLDSTNSGAGGGTVTSTPPGIVCSGSCSALFDANTSITLTQNANFGSYFAGWSGGGCSGTGTCQISMNNEKNVTASFSSIIRFAAPTASATLVVPQIKFSVPEGEGVSGYLITETPIIPSSDNSSWSATPPVS